MNTRINKLILALMLAVAPLAAWSADTRLVLESETDPVTIMGQTQPAESFEATVWIGEHGVRRDEPNQSYLARFDENVLYFIDHGAQSYVKLQLPVELSDFVGEEQLAMVEQMMGMMEMEAEVDDTGEEDTIGEWNARKYIVRLTGGMGMSITQEVWMTTEIDVDLTHYDRLAEELAALAPGGGEWVEEIRAIDGFAVKTEMISSVMGAEIRSRERLVSVDTMDAPAGHFEPPADYREEEPSPEMMEDF